MSPYDDGVDPADLDERQLLHELESVHRTRHETFLYGSSAALAAHTGRMTALETEYLRRHPDRQPASGRTRAGARER